MVRQRFPFTATWRLVLSLLEKSWSAPIKKSFIYKIKPKRIPLSFQLIHFSLLWYSNDDVFKKVHTYFHISYINLSIFMAWNYDSENKTPTKWKNKTSILSCCFRYWTLKIMIILFYCIHILCKIVVHEYYCSAKNRLLLQQHRVWDSIYVYKYIDKVIHISSRKCSCHHITAHKIYACLSILSVHILAKTFSSLFPLVWQKKIKLVTDFYPYWHLLQGNNSCCCWHTNTYRGKAKTDRKNAWLFM